MGLVMFLLLACFVGTTIWGAFKNKDERKASWVEFQEAPAKSIFMILWIGSIFVFVVGVFVPFFGEVDFFETGWAWWQIGGVSAFLGWVVTWFWRMN